VDIYIQRGLESLTMIVLMGEVEVNNE
jgi:hypothetical protein